MSSSIFNVGIIGYGKSAKTYHVPFIQRTPQLNIHAVVQRDMKSTRSVKLDLPNAVVYASTIDLLRDDAVHLILITTPPETHFELAKQALLAEKHVVAEKPFVPTVAEADVLIGLAKQKQRILTVFQNRRWDVDFLTLSKLIKEDRLGRILEFNTHFDRYRPETPAPSWRTDISRPGNGPVFDLGTHLLDQVVVLFGLPRSVTGFLLQQRQGPESNGADSFTIVLKYEGEMVVNVKSAVISAEQEQLRFWIRGHKGSYKKHGFDPQEDQLRLGLKPSNPAFGTEDYGSGTLTEQTHEGIKEIPFLNVLPLSYGAFYEGLVRALLGEQGVEVTANQAREVIRLVELVYHSARDEKTIYL